MLPDPMPDLKAPSFDFLARTGASGADIASVDWARHPLGAMSAWPDELRIALHIMLSSAFPSALAWGAGLHCFHNDAYLSILGDREVRGQGLPLAELWPEAWHELEPVVMPAFRGQPVSFENYPFQVWRFGRWQSAYFTFSYSPVPGPGGTHGGVLSTLVETTDTVLANLRLMESEERLQMALDASGDIGTWSHDPSTGTTIGDARCAAMLGLDAGQMREGMPIERVNQALHPEDRLPALAAVERALADGGTYEAEHRVPLTDGSVRWIAARGRLVAGSDAKAPVRFAGVLQDVSGRKQAEHEAVRASARKDEFLAMLAHELRNPLAPIRAAADLIAMGRLDEARLQQVSAIISRQVVHLTGLVDDLLDVSRVTRGLVTLDRAPLDVRKAVLAAAEQVRPLFEQKGHQLTLALSSDAASVAGDEKRLVQVVANLLANAARYTPHSGHVTVSLGLHDAVLSLVVSDDGIGMSEELLERAFELFTQGERAADRTQGGLGIGLALVRSLVELHGGTVTARSAGVGSGSEFEVRLPVLSDSAAPDTSPTRPPPQRGAESRNILVVDDNHDAAAALAMVLEALGHRCVVEHDSHSALERALGERPDVCLLDIGLPDMDGNALAMRLRSSPETAHCLLIAVTGYGQDQDRAKTTQAGFDHHLVKPLDISRLAELIAGARQR
jgi:PAS domain S-box-containing protein